MLFYSLRIYVNEVGFHCRAPSEAETMSGTAFLRSWYHSAARNESLIRCLQATKDYLDKWLSLPLNAGMDCNMADFTQLIYVVLVLGTFATKFDSPILLQQVSNFEHYLNALSDKIAQLISTQSKGSNDYMVHFHALFQQSKIWYSRLRLDSAGLDNSTDSNPDFSFMEMFPTLSRRCVDFCELSSNSTSTDMSEISSGDLWQDILANWETTLDPSSLAIDGSSQ